MDGPHPYIKQRLPLAYAGGRRFLLPKIIRDGTMPSLRKRKCGTGCGTTLHKRRKYGIYAVTTDQGVGGSNPLAHGQQKSLTNPYFKRFVGLFLFTFYGYVNRTYGAFWGILGYIGVGLGVGLPENAVL